MTRKNSPMETIINVQYTALLFISLIVCAAKMDLIPYGKTRILIGLFLFVLVSVALSTTLIRIWG